jgi:prenyltransferase beta subunit
MEVRRQPEFFGEAELDLLYMARRLREALKLETLLTEAGLDYLVETGSYTGGFLMRRELTGAFFYVAPADLARARDLLLKNRYRPYQSEH